MIPTPPLPRFEPGTLVKATQRVRVGHREWYTSVVGVVERESVRPVGGSEMGGKGLYVRQSTFRLRREDGEATSPGKKAKRGLHVTSPWGRSAGRA